MILESMEINPSQTLSYDICIIGSGAAGITMAREFVGTKQQVCVLESGGRDYEAESQALHEGDIISDFSHHPLNVSRLRQLGGTTNHWSGTCRPFGSLTFERREGIPFSGWPIKLEELQPYLEKAHQLCKLPGPFNYDNDYWGKFTIPTGSRLANICFQKAFPVRFNIIYGVDLEAADNVQVCLHSTVLELISNNSGNVVTTARVKRKTGGEFFVSAKRFVLAGGGIENARLLLLSNGVNKNGMANSRDMVGRFFTNHPGVYAAELVPSNEYLGARFFFDVNKKKQQEATKAQLRPRLVLDADTIRSEQLNQIMFDFYPKFKVSGGVKAAREIRDDLSRGEFPDEFLSKMGRVLSDLDEVIPAIFRDPEKPAIEKMTVVIEIEQSPNPDSRVKLSEKLDSNGQRRVALDWRLSNDDKLRTKRSFEILAAELAAAGIGRMKLTMDESDAQWIGGYHQMGTTRMSLSPNEGVVDVNCKAHELENLYIAGSSVFPVVGIERPTLNLVALTLRLTDHLKSKIGESP